MADGVEALTRGGSDLPLASPELDGSASEESAVVTAVEKIKADANSLAAPIVLMFLSTLHLQLVVRRTTDLRNAISQPP